MANVSRNIPEDDRDVLIDKLIDKAEQRVTDLLKIVTDMKAALRSAQDDAQEARDERDEL